MKNLNFLKDTYFAHRGLHDAKKGIYENTLEAFDLAIQNGYGIELDTNILRDGTVVVYHDRDLVRLCQKNIILKEVGYDDIKDVPIMQSTSRIHTLEKVLKYIDGRVPVLIELKPFGNYKQHAKVVADLIHKYPHEVAIQSFSPMIVHWFKKHDPHIIRGQISEFFKDGRMSKITKIIMKPMWLNVLSKPDFINYGFHDIPNKYVDKAKAKGLLIMAYSVSNQQDLDFMRKHYDNAVFEHFIPKK